jgi:hypothetical protein
LVISGRRRVRLGGDLGVIRRGGFHQLEGQRDLGAHRHAILAAGRELPLRDGGGQALGHHPVPVGDDADVVGLAGFIHGELQVDRRAFVTRGQIGGIHDADRHRRFEFSGDDGRQTGINDGDSGDGGEQTTHEGGRDDE